MEASKNLTNLSDLEAVRRYTLNLKKYLASLATIIGIGYILCNIVEEVKL